LKQPTPTKDKVNANVTFDLGKIEPNRRVGLIALVSFRVMVGFLIGNATVRLT
jgi:hypothetical protein